MKTLPKIFFLILIFGISTPFAQSSDDSDSDVHSSASTYKYNPKKPATTQKAYKITNDGKNQNSQVLEYNNTTPFKGYQDNDLDGTFGESETRLQDLDHDGRKGEKEIQLGTENVTQNEKITVLNNMGLGGSLSNFKAAGQTQRPYAVDEKTKKQDAAELLQIQEEETPVDASAAAAKDETTPKKPHRVLVS